MSSDAPTAGTRASLSRTTTVEPSGSPVTLTISLVDGCTVELRSVLWIETGDFDTTERGALVAMTRLPDVISTRIVSL